MRNTLALIAGLITALALVPGCGKKDDDAKEQPAPKTTAPPPKPEPPKELTAEDKVAMTESCWAAGDARNEAKLADCYHADAVISFPDNVPPMQAKGGKTAVDQLFKPFWTAFSDLHHTLGLIAVNGDKIAVFGTLEGTNDGELMGMPATKKPVAMWFAQVVDLKDGKVVRDDHYFDSGTLMAQLGVSPNPMAPAADSIEAPTEVTKVMAGDEATEKANLDVLAKSEALMKDKDYKAMIDLYADDAEFRFMAGNEASKGKDAIAKDMKQWTDMHSALETTTRDAWAAGDWVIAETTAKGTLAKNLPGTKVKTKGKSYESQYLEFMHFTDGKVDKHWIFTNSGKWAADLGLFDPSKMGGAAK